MKKNILLLLLLTFAALGSKAQSKEHQIKIYSALADTAYAQKDYLSAYYNYSFLIEYDPNNGKAYRRMGYVMLISVNENEKALKYLNRAIEINPKDDDSYRLLCSVYMKMAKAGDKEKNKALALQALKQAMALGNEDAKEIMKELDAL